MSSLDTLSDDLSVLSPNSMFLTPKRGWGRLYPMIRGVRAVDLDTQCIKLGTKEDCDVVIDNIPHVKSISKQHLQISKDSNGPAVITDLSKNGTFLNGVLIGKGNSNVLQNNDEISMVFKHIKVYSFKTLDSIDDDYLPTQLRRKYQISGLLGKGACGEVKLAFDTETYKAYAIKKITKAVGSQCDSNLMNHPKKIYNEIEILEFLSHPCVTSVRDVAETDENVFIVMDYMEGGQLTNLIHGPQKLTEKEIQFLFFQMVLSVEYLHKEGVIHRDLKPENVLLKCNSIDTLIQVSDFGLSKIIEEDTIMETLCGTPNYVAPEVLDYSIKYYNDKVDVWSLGVILYYMLTQQLPFRPTKRCNIFVQILIGKYDQSSAAFAKISNSCKDLLKKMLMVKPDDRISIVDIIQHPWFDDRVKNKVHELIQSQIEPNLLNSESSKDIETFLSSNETRPSQEDKMCAATIEIGDLLCTHFPRYTKRAHSFEKTSVELKKIRYSEKGDEQ